MSQVIHRTGQRGLVQDPINGAVPPRRLANVRLPIFEGRIRLQVLQVPQRSCDEIVDAEDRMPLSQKPVAKVRTNEPRGYRDNETQDLCGT